MHVVCLMMMVSQAIYTACTLDHVNRNVFLLCCPAGLQIRAAAGVEKRGTPMGRQGAMERQSGATRDEAPRVGVGQTKAADAARPGGPWEAWGARRGY